MASNHSNLTKKSSFWKNPLTWVCIIALGYWIYCYHLEHAMGALPYMILLLCPLMHIFMHHGHGHGHGHGESDKDRENQTHDGGGENAR